jgi:hypothetical protein
MGNRLLSAAVIVSAISLPIAARAQSQIVQSDVTTGVARSTPAVVNGDVAGIADDQRSAFREYISREHVPTYTMPERVVIGGILPEIGVTYYDVPQSFAVTPYRYTVVNGETILVDPHSRRIVQLVD